MNTPSHHRVHHGTEAKYIDKNYGGIFILWDRLFGTFQEELDDDPVVFGVRKPLANWNPIWANLQVYDYLLFDARKASRWRDRLGIWFRRTGWRPPDVEGRYPRQRTDIETFQKFDPAVPASQRRYVMAQFVVAIAGTLFIAEWFASFGARAVLLPCIMLWTQLYTVGLLNEGRSTARRMELLRLLIVVPTFSWLLRVSPGGLDVPDGAVVVMVGYVAASLTWLMMLRPDDELTMSDEHA